MGWRYEGLFEAELHPETEDLSRFWRTEPSMIPVGKMGYRRRTTIAGQRLECEIYPVFGREDERKARAAKRNQTKEAQKRVNRRRAEQRIVQLADANFGEEDIELTLTYRNTWQPDFDRCQKDVRNFLLRIKRYREKHGMEPLRYIYCIEGGQEKKRGFGTTKFHCHMMMNGGVDREILEEIWEFGYANTRRLQPDEDWGLEQLAKYMIKESKQGGRRRFCASRNLKPPKTRKIDAQASNRTVKAIARDIRNEAKIEMEKLYKGYRFVQCTVFYSDQLDGVYIRVVMRKENEKRRRKR